MRKTKKTTALILAAAMMVSMAGCGKKESGDSTDTPVEVIGIESKNEEDYDWTTTEESVEEKVYPTNAGDVVTEYNFDDGEKAGFTTYTNGGAYELNVEDGKLTCAIDKTGSVEHGCQAYVDGFALLQNCVYTYTFDISCDITRTIEWRLQINSGDYHAYASEKITLGPETQTVNVDFVMEEESDPAPRLVFNMGKFAEDSDLAAHKISIDNIKLSVKDGSQAIKIEAVPTPKRVRVNQVGYAPTDKKYVLTASEEEVAFKVVNVETDETVYVGEYGEAVNETAFNEKTKLGDFTALTTPGKYKIISAPSGESYEFEIGEDLYKDIYKDVVLMLYNQRCGTELDPAISGDFAHDACHMGSALVYDDPSAPAKDVSGGWHDAGDYGRYVVPAAKTIQDLFLAYEDYDITLDDIGIPESGNGTPDLLDEARYELEWMFKMQDEASGGVYHKVTALVFPETVLAVDETDQLYLAPISYTATGDFAAVMAKASMIYKEYDADFAAKCLEASKKAYDFMIANENMSMYKNPDEIVTGEYPDFMGKDEAYWAAAELYIATGEDKYKEGVLKYIDEFSVDGLGWASIGTFASYDLAKAENVDETIKTKAKDRIIKNADSELDKCKRGNLGVSQYDSFCWGSNMAVANTAQLFLMANNLTGNEEYLDFAMRQRDYIFGVNGPSYCFVTGYGDNTPTQPHHRPSQVLGKPMPGMLIGGPDNALEDPYALAVLVDFAPGMAYVDNVQSFSCNEITIYWNSPLIYLMSGLGCY